MNPARPVKGVPSAARKPIGLVPQVQLETERAGEAGVSNVSSPRLPGSLGGGGRQDRGGKCQSPNKHLSFYVVLIQITRHSLTCGEPTQIHADPSVGLPHFRA